VGVKEGAIKEFTSDVLATRLLSFVWLKNTINVAAKKIKRIRIKKQ